MTGVAAYVCLVPEPGAEHLADQAADRLIARGWRRLSSMPLVMAPPGRGPELRRLGRHGALIGRHTGADRLLAAKTCDEAADRLLSRGWGRYVALWSAPDGLRVLRDPSGGLDALCWRRDGLRVVASDVDDDLVDLLPRRSEIRLDRLASILAHPGAAAGDALLDGVTSVPPGGLFLWPWDGPAQTVLRWRPGAQAGRTVAPEQLRQSVDEAVQVMSRPHGRLLGEISGGFDSAVVSTSAVALGAPVSRWLNFYAAQAEADERVYAEAVASRAGVRLLTRRKTPRAIGLVDLEALAAGARPALQGLDVEYDALTARLMAQTGATGLLTGQGGDAVFYQYGTPALAIDRMRRMGVRGISPGFLHQTARWTRRSAWFLLAVAIRDRLGWAQLPEEDDEEEDSPPPPPGADVHPWLVGLEDAPPAKRAQIRQLVNCQIFWGDCLRARSGELLHPLLSQPVMEAGLALPADVLTHGGRDRALARRLFADRIPRLVLDRRGKGELSAYYGEVVRRSLPLARDLLHDGRLMDAGLVDAAEVDRLLDPGILISSGAYNLVLIRMALEVWVRRWSVRLATRREPFA